MLEVLVKDLALTEPRLLPRHLNKKHRTLIHAKPVPVYLPGHMIISNWMIISRKLN
jgi:hypothetical protein